MAIEFRCPNCQSLLQVPDGNVGRSVRCPQCEAVATVPGVAEPGGTDFPPPPAAYESSPGGPPPLESSNPYAAGTADGANWTQQNIGPRTPPPWEVSPSLSTFWRTLTLSWQNPDLFYRTIPQHNGLGLAMLFYLLATVIGAISQAIVNIPFQLMGVAAGPAGFAGGGENLLMVMFIALATIAISPLLQLIGTIILACFAHLVMRLLGSAEGRLEASQRAMLYSGGSLGILAAIPICGAYVAALGMLIIGPWALARLHDAPLWKGFVSYYAFGVLCLLFIVALVVLTFADAGMLPRNF